jgi:hypothetical protein
VAGVTAGFGALAVAGPAPQEEKVVFSMNAQHIGTGRGGMTAMSITVERWSSPDERDALEEILISGGMQALADALRSAPRVGFIRAPRISNTGWQLRYAMMYQGIEPGTRVIRIATDRPISFEEAFNNNRALAMRWTWNYNTIIIEMTVDEEGNGSGVLSAGVELRYDEDNDTITVANASSQPIRLSNITMKIESR